MRFLVNGRLSWDVHTWEQPKRSIAPGPRLPPPPSIGLSRSTPLWAAALPANAETASKLGQNMVRVLGADPVQDGDFVGRTRRMVKGRVGFGNVYGSIRPRDESELRERAWSSKSS